MLEAATLVGLLADDDRRRAVAALVLGAATPSEVSIVAQIDGARTARALGRLVDAGLVQRGRDGRLVLDGGAFQAAARASAPLRDAAHSDDTVPEVARVRRAFISDGRLVSIPATRSKRLVVLDVLAQEFEPGRRYSEAMVNLVLGRWHPDTAALRRYLVDEGFLDRERGEYWRSGGTVDDKRQ